MPNAYPWSVEKSFKPRMKLRKTVRDFSLLPTILSGLALSPLSFLGLAWGFLSYRSNNNYWRFRGTVLMCIGIVLSAIFYPLLHLNPVDGIVQLLSSFGDKSTPPMSNIIASYLINGFPISLFFAGITTYAGNGYFELYGRRYLENSNPSFFDKLRMKKNKKKFEEDNLTDDQLEIGVVKNDLLPWRQNRYGMIVGTSFDTVKHGYIVGANGTGKTIAEMNMAAEYSDNGWSIVFPDFKGDKKTENMLAAIAKKNNVPFYSFWSNNNDTGLHYDPLLGVKNVSPASIIITAFDFVLDGPAKYYTDQSEKYLALQFKALEEFLEKGENESTFDWLLKTCDPAVFSSLLKPFAGNKDRELAQRAKELIAEINQVNRKDISGLEANLSKVIKTVGHKMRPSEHMIDFRKAAQEKAIVYFGLPSTGDKIVMRALGSLIIRDLVSFSSERQGTQNANVGNGVMIMPDEVSQLQEKADTLLELLQQGRSARMMVFPAMQTFGSFSEKFIRELLGNSPTSIVFRVSDEVTALRLSDTFRDMFVRVERRDSKTSTDFMGSERQEFSSGSAGTIDKGPRVSVEDIGDLENRTALVHFPESSRKATVKKPKPERVSKSESFIDIPVTEMVSRLYILEAENDYDLPLQMLKKTLNQDFIPVESEVVDELDSSDLDEEHYVDSSVDEVEQDDVVMESEADSVESQQDTADDADTDEWGNPISEPEDITSGSVEGVSENVTEYKSEVLNTNDSSSEVDSNPESKASDKEDEGLW